jgi:hypothetical protein
MVDRTFQLCVDFLVGLAKLTGISYQEINVLIFCVVWPVFTLGLILLCAYQSGKIKGLKAALAAREGPKPPAKQ